MTDNSTSVPAATPCPDDTILEQFLLGRLPEPEIDAIHRHLAACAKCQEQARTLAARDAVVEVPQGTAATLVPEFDSMVQRILARMANASFGAQPGDSTDPPETVPEPESLPARLGRYRIEQEIARGGMGWVVRVHDDDFQRPLAMKVLLGRGAKQPGLGQRFLCEARLTGQLQHPGVPPVQELGRLPDGRPYFIMKLIKGQSLAALLTERKTLDQELPRFLNIFEQICQTVGYAHSHDVLHRDLKPANVMVGAFGEVQVMDWGLAKVLRSKGDGQGPQEDENASSLFLSSGSTDLDATAEGSVLGTLAYLPPEQARGEIESLDLRADVFGLGGVLCDILTGKPPFAGGSPQDKLRRAKRGDLAEAFTRLDRCGADAELIQLARQCLAPDKSDRPTDAGAVAVAVAKFQADLQRRLKQAEIHQARVQAQLIEEAKRRRVRAALILVSVLFALATGGAGLWYLQSEADQAQKQARSDADKAARQEILEAGMIAALNEEEVKHKKLQDRLTNPTQVHVLLSNIDGWKTVLKTRAGILKNAAKLWASGQGLLAADLQERLQKQQARLEGDEKDFELGENLDAIRLRAATANDGKFDGAGPAGEYATVFAGLKLDVQQGDPATVATQISKSSVRLVLVAALDHWAQMVSTAKVKVEAKLVSHLLEVAKRVDPDPWRDQVRAAVAVQDTAGLQELANQAKKLEEQSPQIILLLAWNLPKEGSARADLLGKALAHHPADFWLHFDLGTILTDPAECVGCFRAALAVRPTSGAAHYNLGTALYGKKDLEGAIAQFQQAITLNPKHANAHNNLGNALKAKGDLDGAITQYQKAIALNPNHAIAHYNLGLALHDKKDLDGAITHFKQAITLDPTYVTAHHNLGIALKIKGDLDGAITHFQKAITLDPNHANAHNSLGLALKIKGDLDGAITHFKQAITLNPNHVDAHNNLGIILLDRKDLDGAITHFKQASMLNPNHVDAHYNLGLALHDKKDLTGAIAHYEQAITLNPNHADAHNNLGIILLDKKDLVGAITHFKQASTLNPKDAAAPNNLGNALYIKKDMEGAIKQFQQAIALDPKFALPRLGLGLALLNQGQFAEAQQDLTKGLTLLAKNYPTRKFFQDQLQKCEQLLGVDQKVSAILQGEASPGTAAEQLQFAEFCQKYRKYGAATKLYEGAFSKEPALLTRLGQVHRYHAACVAALAAAGKGNDAATLAVNDKAKLRQQALGWLQDELAAHTKTLAKPQEAAAVAKQLQQWQHDPNLAGVRAVEELAVLPEEERKAWQQLWADVDGLLKKATELQKPGHD